ncbi:MAG: hypothetical protein GWN58_13715 [Anaerolineae bacterium]|nr:hypothetical protein [Anaerolineae bacterium]
MATITASTPVAQTRYLSVSDPTGETFVVIKPPDYGAETERGELLSKRTLVPDGTMLRTQVETNLNQLWALELWLTYVETNLVVEFEDDQGNTTKTVRFEPRDQMSRAEFLNRLAQLPPGVVYEWHACVVDVVRDWSVPF